MFGSGLTISGSVYNHLPDDDRNLLFTNAVLKKLDTLVEFLEERSNEPDYRPNAQRKHRYYEQLADWLATWVFFLRRKYYSKMSQGMIHSAIQRNVSERSYDYDDIDRQLGYILEILTRSYNVIDIEMPENLPASRPNIMFNEYVYEIGSNLDPGNRSPCFEHSRWNNHLELVEYDEQVWAQTAFVFGGAVGGEGVIGAGGYKINTNYEQWNQIAKIPDFTEEEVEAIIGRPLPPRPGPARNTRAARRRYDDDGAGPSQPAAKRGRR